MSYADDAEFEVGHIFDNRINDASGIEPPTDEEIREVFGFGVDEDPEFMP